MGAPRKRSDRSCRKCGSTFYPKTDQQSYCSRRCFQSKVLSQCPSCGQGKVAPGRKYCSRDCYLASVGVVSHRMCKSCGNKFTARTRKIVYCSTSCAAVMSRLEMSRAYASGEYKYFISLVEGRSRTADNGCWEWSYVNAYGYPVSHILGRPRLVHRMVVEATEERKINFRETVHHKCANRRCVRPDHLEIASRSENNLEMHSRKSLDARIAALETALREIDPDHPLLGHTQNVEHKETPTP